MIPIDLIHNNNQTSYQNKKVEKNDDKPKYKNMKSTELLKETNKNSYFSKYIEECNRNKLNKKNNNNPLRQSKRAEPKDSQVNNHSNLSLFSYKKSKTNSMDKNINSNYNINNNLANTNLKKYAKDLSKEFNENKNNDKSTNIIDMTPREISQSNNSLINIKSKPKNRIRNNGKKSKSKIQ